MEKEPDKWSSWLTTHRYGNNKQLEVQTTARLERIRDRLIRKAVIVEGNIVLDIGTGDGLIGLEALKSVGQKGKVYFTDISEAALGIVRKRLDRDDSAKDRSEFIVQSADNLDQFTDGSVDVITGRSVIMYVANKPKSFREFFRVLKPGGRLSIFEPINRFSALRSPNFLGLDFSELDPALAEKILKPLKYPLDFDNDSMLNFDERDLFSYAENVGFKEVKIDYEAFLTAKVMLQPWESFLDSSANPLTPPIKEILNSLNPEEKQIAVNFLLRAWKRPLRPAYHAEVYVTATKIH